MKFLLTILMFISITATAQIKGTIGSLTTLAMPGGTLTKIATTWGVDKSPTTITTMAALADAINKNTTSIFYGYGLTGTGISANDPIKIDRALMLENIFYEAKLDDIRYWRKLEKMIFWAKDVGDYVYWRQGTLRRVVSEPVDQPVKVQSDDVIRKLVKRVEALEAEVKDSKNEIKKLKGQLAPGMSIDSGLYQFSPLLYDSITSRIILTEQVGKTKKASIKKP